MTDVYSADPYAQFLGPPQASPPPVAPSVAPISPTIRAESGGNVYAKNPNSSAAGPGQFIDSTWLDMINKYRPDLAGSMSKDQILGLRTDPKYTGLSKSMTDAYAAENSVALSNAGLESNAGNTYLAHFAGPQGAISVLKADPNTPVSKVLSADAIKANPFLANMTTGQLQQWAAGKVGAPAEGYYGGRMHVTVPAGQQSNNDPYAVFTSINGPSVSTGGALLEGALSGVSANFRDEIYGASKASGLPDILGGFRAPVGAAKLAYEHLTGQPGEASRAYDEAVAQIRARQAAAQQERPLAYGVGQFGGAVGGMLLAPGEAAATLLGRIAQGAAIGGTYGAVAGAGEGTDLASRATGAVTGATSGAIGGGAAVPLGEAAGAIGKAGYNYLIKPAVSVGRGLINPEGEAARRVVGALSRDARAGRSGLTPSEWLAAHSSGEPVAITDLGGATTQNLLRSAANTSPEAESAIRNMAQSRYETQNTRFADSIRGLIANGANAAKSRSQLEAEYDKVREPLYAAAYRAGSKGVWNDEIKRLSGTPSIQDAIRGAVAPMRDRGIIAGYKLPRSNPFAPNPFKNGAMELREDKNGNKIIPELAFWDQIVRNLNGRIGELMRSGNDTRARDIIQLKNALTKELDTAVPSYAKARGTAAEYFGANDAIEAGEKAVSFKGDPILIKVQMNKMGDAERELFKEGFANKLAENIEATGDRTNVINKVYNSPQSRRMIDTVFGKEGATAIEMRLRIENIMQAAKDALGNSTTAKQLIQSGLAGGALGAYLEGHDFMGALKGAGEGFSVGAGMRFGGGKLVGVIDQRTAQKVGELLASNDLNQLRKGINIAVRNNRISNAIRTLDNRLSAYLGSSGGNKAVGLLPPGTISSAAQPQQQQ